MAIPAEELVDHDWVNLAEIRLPRQRPFLVSGWQGIAGGRTDNGGIHGGSVQRVNVICIFQRTAAVINHQGDPLDIRQVPLERIWIDLRHGIWKVNRELRQERQRSIELELRLQEFQAALCQSSRGRRAPQ